MEDEIDIQTDICPQSFLDLSSINKTVLDQIRSYLEPDVNDKKMFGEVFTPLQLVCDMLSKLPRHVWTNPNLLWMDPANGIGNFPMVVYYKLMTGLKQYIPNEAKRSKHIIEKMLWMVELNPINVNICKKLFKLLDENSTPNITRGSFIEESTIHKLPEAFDIIMGNPPYQAIQNSDGKRGGGDMLWDKFVKQSIRLLRQNGLLCFVHPAAWRKPESERSKNNGLFEIMAHENQLLYLEIHDTTDGQEVFHSGTRYDWYVLQKKPCTRETVVKGDDGIKTSINLRQWEFLPNRKFTQIEPLLHDKDEKHEKEYYIIYERSSYGSDKKWVQEEKTTEFNYPLIHSTPKSGIRYMYSSRNDNGMFGISKIIFGDSGIFNSIIDMEGRYGMTQHSMAIPISSIEKGTEIKRVIDSDEFRNILDACSWSNFSIDWRLFSYFKKDFYNYIQGPFHYIGQSKVDSKERKGVKSKTKKIRKHYYSSKSKHEIKQRELFRKSITKIKTINKHKTSVRRK
jgi:hypothetical protein